MALVPVDTQHPWWYRVGRLILAVIGFALFMMGQLFVYDLLSYTLLGPLELGSLEDMIASWFSFLLAALLSTYAIWLLQGANGWQRLRFKEDQPVLSIQHGLLGAICILGFTFIVLLLGHWVAIESVDWDASLFSGWLLFFLIQPLAEEVVMRPFLQQHIEQAAGAQIALLATALVFAVIHAGNDNFTWLAGIQIFTGGYLMGQLFLLTGSTWTPFLFHAAWNFVQSIVLGFSVSGMDTYRVLQLRIQGPAWLTGGDFGLEGSVLTLVLLIFACVCYHYRLSRTQLL